MVAQTLKGPVSLPRNLGPRAKRSLLTAEEQSVLCALELAPTASRNAFEHEILALGAQILSWDETGRVLTLRVAASELAQIARMKGVVYIEKGERYTR